jgi:hypothetical protein
MRKGWTRRGGGGGGGNDGGGVGNVFTVVGISGSTFLVLLLLLKATTLAGFYRTTHFCAVSLYPQFRNRGASEIRSHDLLSERQTRCNIRIGTHVPI